MLRSMYSGVSGMKGFQTKLDVIGNNISNVNTIGFKKGSVSFKDLLSQTVSNSGANPMQVGLGSNIAAINTVHTAGSLMNTGVDTDVSIMGEGFFVVQKPLAPNAAPNERPEEYLTRLGSFTTDPEGNLVTAQGYNVLGIAPNGGTQNGIAPVKVDPAVYDSFQIKRNGEVVGKTKDGIQEVITTLGIVKPTNPGGLKKVGESLYEMTVNADGDGSLGRMENGNFIYEDINTPETLKIELISGALEMSNVDLAEEFTEMIVAQRGFQANSRIISVSDEILQELVNLKR